MAAKGLDPSNIFHVVAMPYPGRGHINPLLNFCKLIAIGRPANIVVTFIVTEEWHGFLSSEILPTNLRLTAIPQVVPSEIGRAKDWAGFVRAALTKMEEPVEELLDRIQLPKPCVIISDTFMKWVVEMGNRRNIPVASFWTQSATVFSILRHFDLIVQHGHFGVTLAEKGEELVNYIPGVAPMRLVDLPTGINGKGQELLSTTLECFSLVSKSQYLLFTSTYELEAPVIDHMRQIYSIPIYSIGPAIPYWKIKPNDCPLIPDQNIPEPEYFRWLDAQPASSVLYISQGSFLSVPSVQLDEIVAGVFDSGVRFFWVTRDEAIRNLKQGENKGIVVPWCDQLRVLCHASVGGFWSHCGWNSTKESIFAGLPVLSFSIFWDQVTNSKQIVEDWKIGWKVKRDDDSLISREEIAKLLQRCMDLESDEGKEVRRRAKQWQETCRKAVEKGGSSSNDVESFMEDITSHYS